MRSAMAAHRGMSMARLARESGVSRGTFYLWFSDQQEPSMWTLGRVAKALGMPVRDLWDAFEGRDTVPSTTEEALHELIGRLDRQDERMMQLVSRLEVLANGAIVAGVVRALGEEHPSPDDTPPPRRRGRSRAPQDSGP